MNPPKMKYFYFGGFLIFFSSAALQAFSKCGILIKKEEYYDSRIYQSK